MSLRIKSIVVLAMVSLSGMTCVRVANAEPTKAPPAKSRILFLHHSTGKCIWRGGVSAWFVVYNRGHHTDYRIVERTFPKDSPYGWNNYPYDYWNIWVRHAGDKPYKDEPTLEMLTKDFDVIVFKHCFPVSAIEPDTGKPDVASDAKTIENYKLQYNALRDKLRSFPKTKFIVWTGAALLESETDEDAARRAKSFFDWVKSTWDEPGDNIYVWDFRRLETDGGLYLKPANAAGDSHPNERFSRYATPQFCQRIVDVITGHGDPPSTTDRHVSPPPTAPKKVKPDKSKPVASKQPDTPSPSKPAAKPAGQSKTAWVFDDAESPKRLRERWGDAVSYKPDGKNHVIKIDFEKGDLQDWGEYGNQRVVSSKRPAKNEDISPFSHLSFRIRADRSMEVVVMLITRPDSLPRDDASYFSFTGYVQAEKDKWQTVRFDLSAMELGLEGDKAYKAAGKPARPMRLSEIHFVTSDKNAAANVIIDDITFEGPAKG